MRRRWAASRRVCGGIQCTVCCEPVADREEALLLPVCGHLFHAECIGQWLAQSASCPNCRGPAPRETLTPVVLGADTRGAASARGTPGGADAREAALAAPAVEVARAAAVSATPAAEVTLELEMH